MGIFRRSMIWYGDKGNRHGYAKMEYPYLEDNVPEPSFPAPTPGKRAPATPLNPRRRGIIIGASDGLGAALARRLARENYSLALIARRKDKLDLLCNELNTSVGTACAYPYVHDVSQHQEVPALLRRIVADLGGLDLVIFCAGINF